MAMPGPATSEHRQMREHTVSVGFPQAQHGCAEEHGAPGDEAAAGHVLPPAEAFAHLLVHRYCGDPNAGHRFLQDHLLSQYTANRAQTKETMSRGSLNHVQNVHLETLADSAADGASSRGTF